MEIRLTLSARGVRVSSRESEPRSVPAILDGWNMLDSARIRSVPAWFLLRAFCISRKFDRAFVRQLVYSLGVGD